jgi:hypothetical protein
MEAFMKLVTLILTMVLAFSVMAKQHQTQSAPQSSGTNSAPGSAASPSGSVYVSMPDIGAQAKPAEEIKNTFEEEYQTAKAQDRIFSTWDIDTVNGIKVLSYKTFVQVLGWDAYDLFLNLNGEGTQAFRDQKNNLHKVWVSQTKKGKIHCFLAAAAGQANTADLNTSSCFLFVDQPAVSAEVQAKAEQSPALPERTYSKLGGVEGYDLYANLNGKNIRAFDDARNNRYRVWAAQGHRVVAHCQMVPSANDVQAIELASSSCTFWTGL